MLARHIAKRADMKRPDAITVTRLVTETYAKHRKAHKSVLRLAYRLSLQYHVGIISDTIPEHTHVNRSLGVYKKFHPVILSCEVGLSKPYRAIFRLALRKAHVRPREAVFIDDLPENIAGACRVGMHGIIFKNIRQLKRDLKKLGVLW